MLQDKEQVIVRLRDTIATLKQTLKQHRQELDRLQEAQVTCIKCLLLFDCLFINPPPRSCQYLQFATESVQGPKGGGGSNSWCFGREVGECVCVCVWTMIGICIVCP